MKELKIGDQIWSKENLRVTTFRNGEAIPIVQEAKKWSKLKTAAMCFTSQGEALYNWYAVNDPRGLAPEGWHIPSDEEWTELTDYMGECAGLKLKCANWDGTNNSGFSALPGGSRHYSGGFNYVGYSAYFWSASPIGSYAWNRLLNSGNDGVYRDSNDRLYGFSVRCVKDVQQLTLEEKVEILWNQMLN